VTSQVTKIAGAGFAGTGDRPGVTNRGSDATARLDQYPG